MDEHTLRPRSVGNWIRVPVSALSSVPDPVPKPGDGAAAGPQTTSNSNAHSQGPEGKKAVRTTGEGAPAPLLSSTAAGPRRLRSLRPRPAGALPFRAWPGVLHADRGDSAGAYEPPRIETFEAAADWPSGPRPCAISVYDTLTVPAGRLQAAPAAWAGPMDGIVEIEPRLDPIRLARCHERDPMAEPAWSPSAFAIASLVFPGMGQRLNGHLRKATVFRSAALMTLVAGDMLLLREPMLASLPSSFPLGPAGAARILSAAALAGAWLWALGAYDAWVVRASLAPAGESQTARDSLPR